MHERNLLFLYIFYRFLENVMFPGTNACYAGGSVVLFFCCCVNWFMNISYLWLILENSSNEQNKIEKYVFRTTEWLKYILIGVVGVILSHSFSQTSIKNKSSVTFSFVIIHFLLQNNILFTCFSLTKKLTSDECFSDHIKRTHLLK